MANLAAALDYLLQKHTNICDTLNPNRLIRVLYLADWKSAISNGKPITNIHWQMKDANPQMDTSSLKTIVDFIERKGRTIGIGVFETGRKLFFSGLSISEKSILDFVLELCKDKGDEYLTHLVYSTYPSMTQSSEEEIDLPVLAKRYAEIQSILDVEKTVSSV